MVRSPARALAALTAAVMISTPARTAACPDNGAAADSCGSNCCAPTDAPPPPALRGGDVFPVDMHDSFFAPAKIIVRPSSVVRWFNAGKDFHTATRDGMFDSGLVNPNDNFEFKFSALTAGFAYSYTCYLHFGMDGVISVARYGDANLDGAVNLTDFNALAANFGTAGPPWEGGDFNEDGAVDLEDFNLLAANFGRDIEPAPTSIAWSLPTHVPEPATVALLLLVGLTLRGRNRSSENHP